MEEPVQLLSPRAAAQPQDQVNRRAIYDTGFRQRNLIVSLPAVNDKSLLVRCKALLDVNLSLDSCKLVLGRNIQRRYLARQGSSCTSRAIAY